MKLYNTYLYVFFQIIEKQKEKPVERREDLKKDAMKTQQRTSVRDLASKIKDGIPVGGSQKKKGTACTS